MARKRTLRKRTLRKRTLRKKPLRRVRRTKTGTGWVLEEVFTPAKRFKKGAMTLLVKGPKRKSTFVSVKPRRDVLLQIGCLPKDFSKQRGVCQRTTIHKKIKQISKRTAQRLTGKALKNTQLMIINPQGKRTRKVTRRPACPKNPCPSYRVKRRNRVRAGSGRASTSNAMAKVGRAYKRFHFTRPSETTWQNVPPGWPTAYMVIGELERFDVVTPGGREVSKKFSGKRPILATTGAMKDCFIFGDKSLGIPSGRAARVDYRVPAHSGRNQWARRWYHPHASHPSVNAHRGGRAVRISGSKLRVTPRGIVG